MRLLGGGQEVLTDLVEDVDRCDGELILKELNIITELVELCDKDGLVNLSHLLLTGISEVNQMEL